MENIHRYAIIGYYIPTNSYCEYQTGLSLSHLIVLAKNMLPLLENGHLKMLCVNGQEVAVDGIKVVNYDIIYWKSNERKNDEKIKGRFNKIS